MANLAPDQPCTQPNRRSSRSSSSKPSCKWEKCRSNMGHQSTHRLVISGSETNHRWGHFWPLRGEMLENILGEPRPRYFRFAGEFWPLTWMLMQSVGLCKFQAKCCQLAVVAGTHLQLLWLRRWILPWIPIWLRRCCWVHIEVSICGSSLYLGVRLGWKIHGCHHGIWTPSWDRSL